MLSCDKEDFFERARKVDIRILTAFQELSDVQDALQSTVANRYHDDPKRGQRAKHPHSDVQRLPPSNGRLQQQQAAPQHLPDKRLLQLENKGSSRSISETRKNSRSMIKRFATEVHRAMINFSSINVTFSAPNVHNFYTKY